LEIPKDLYLHNYQAFIRKQFGNSKGFILA
jgi:hypothetical protein